ncbi:uncharacterized protein LOC122368001 [Amphibalanus amphitrite]|uniref:uncharacterized protein LOC122368001 n=1 Tax=Amphibalanus amphitrite TaxID=1232801 RepID=UPI001C904162|nr:uncharacterized protein LOC122368001 [Amphibalanus amphitrite]
MVPTMLDTNREHLVWPGVPAGSRAVKPLFIKNGSDTDTMQLTLAIQDSPHFKFEAFPKPSSSLEVAMPPRSERNVNVVFEPTSCSSYRGTVVIRTGGGGQLERRDVAMIPLSGYGGASDVQIYVNAREAGRPCLSLNAAGPGGTRLATFSIANIGQRAAYIKLLAFTDLSCERPLPAHQASLHPSEFILRPSDSRQVSVVTPPVSDVQDVGAVLVLSGDETLRQELRRRPPGAPPSPHTPDNLRSVNFQAPYDGESQDNQAGSSLEASIDKMEDIFYSNMKKTKLPLKYLPRPPAQAPQLPPPQPKPHEMSTPYSRPSVELQQARTQLPAAPTRPLDQLQQLQRQTTPLELTKRSASPLSAVPVPVARPGGPPTDTGWWPRPPGQQQLISERGQAKLRISTNHLMFARTPLGTPRSLSIQLTNLSQEVIKWNIFGYSMPYLITGVNQMVKCGYDVFKMRPKEDSVRPGETLTLQVTFSPPYPGQLTQLFQLLCKPAKEAPGQPMVVYTLPVQVSGRGSILDEGEDESDLITAPLHVSQDYLFFRHWSICHKLEITNKMRDELPVEYRVSGPFKVVAGPNESTLMDLTEGHMMAPSQRYVQMYVYFCPEQAGAFSGQLKLWLKSSGWRHLVRLEGTCQDVDHMLQIPPPTG